MSKREQDLEAIVRRLMPATRDVMWCALVWNDHNFSHDDLRDKAVRAAKALGYERRGLGDAVDAVNDFLAHVDSVLGAPQHSGEQGPRAESATDIQLHGCRLHKRRDCKVC